MNKNIIAIIIVAVVAFGGYFLLRDSSTGISPQEMESGNIVIYFDGGYAPSTITIKAGDAVTFKNQSSQAMWTASAIHPTHRLYPTTGGCLGSTFDACHGVQLGDSWPFKFDIPGTWKYHNHLNPSDTGTVIVTQ